MQLTSPLVISHLQLHIHILFFSYFLTHFNTTFLPWGSQVQYVLMCSVYIQGNKYLSLIIRLKFSTYVLIFGLTGVLLYTGGNAYFIMYQSVISSSLFPFCMEKRAELGNTPTRNNNGLKRGETDTLFLHFNFDLRTNFTVSFASSFKTSFITNSMCSELLRWKRQRG